MDMKRAHGHWKKSPQETISQGYLEFGEDGPIAYMLGLDTDENTPYFISREKYSELDSAVLVSLERKVYSCFNMSSEGSSHGFSSKPSEVLHKYRCQIVLEGQVGFNNLEDKIFKSISSEVENVMMWSGLNPHTKPRRFLSISAKVVSSPKYFYKGLRVSFSTTISMTSPTPAVAIVPTGVINIMSNRLTTIFELYKVFLDMKLLLTVLCGKNLSVYKQSAETKFNPRKIGRHTFRESLNVITRLNNRTNIDYWRFEPIIGLDDVDNLQNLLMKWENRSESLNRSASVLSLTAIDKAMAVDARFISLISSLESLCGYSKKEYYMDKSAYKKIFKKIRDSYESEIESEEFKAVLNGRIGNANEISLRSKILKVIEESYPIVEGRTDMSSEFLAKALTANRNYIAHGGTESTKFLAKNPELLYWLTEYARLLLLYKFLTELGISSEIVIKKLRSTLSNSTFKIMTSQFSSENSEHISKNSIL